MNLLPDSEFNGTEFLPETKVEKEKRMNGVYKEAEKARISLATEYRKGARDASTLIDYSTAALANASARIPVLGKVTKPVVKQLGKASILLDLSSTMTSLYLWEMGNGNMMLQT